MRIIWRRLLTNPTTHVESVDGDVTRLKVDGLVCDQVCAVRTRDALRKIDGVRDVSVDLDSGVATIVGRRAPAAEYERAVMGAVVGKPVRRLIERVARRFGAESSSGAEPEARR